MVQSYEKFTEGRFNVNTNYDINMCTVKNVTYHSIVYCNRYLCICVHMDPCNLNLCNLETSCTSLRGDHIRVGHVVRNAYRIFVERSNSVTTKDFERQH